MARPPIKRISSSNREPDASPQQHQLLRDLVASKVREKYPELTEYDPVVSIALIACDPAIQSTDRATVLRAHAEVARYIHPTLKQIEVSGVGGGAVKVRAGLTKDIVDLIMQIKQKEST
jgi:hypothetical protein